MYTDDHPEVQQGKLEEIKELTSHAERILDSALAVLAEVTDPELRAYATPHLFSVFRG